jgi:hypothetical protein
MKIPFRGANPMTLQIFINAAERSKMRRAATPQDAIE